MRVETALVQTDVMVFDKQGKFVDGLQRDQFVLKIDGKPHQISFFEKVQAGSPNEEAQLAAARGNANNSPSEGPVPLDRGRTVFFFIDDLHLSAESMNQARTLLGRFVDREMGQNDQAAIVTTTGQLGFLQQLTDNKKVLLTAVRRLKPRSYSSHDMQQPPMSEYQALRVDQNDNDVLGFYVDYLLRENPMLGRDTAQQEVHGRASSILHVAAAVTTNTLSSLKNMIDLLAAVPGRKVIFLLSDGFFLDERNSDAYDRLRQITSAAAATGFVIYSIDARGLATGMPDAATPTAFDTSGRLSRGGSGELIASQDALSALAIDTGGRAFFNSNLLSTAVTTALKESSVYYLLAWRPENEERRNPKFHRIEVGVIGRPELFVRFHHGFGDSSSLDTGSKTRTKPTPEVHKPQDELRAALRSAYPKAGLPVALSLNFLNTLQRGDLVVSSLSIATRSLVFEDEGGIPVANIAVTGIVLDDQGKIVDSFDRQIILRKKGTAQTARLPENIYYNNYSALKPGLYQVRVAVMQEKRGLAGSAWQWIEVPDLSSKTLTLSSLIVGERRTDPQAETTTTEAIESGKAEAPFHNVNMSVDHRFARSSYLRLLTFVYNASGAHNPSPTTGSSTSKSGNDPPPPAVNNSADTTKIVPDLAVQVQVFRDNEPVLTDPLHKINTDGISDLTRLPYAADLALSNLQPGRYVLQVTVIDRLAKTSASQRFNFEVD